MSNLEAVKQWRKSTKERIVTSMGGCCQICGYSKSTEALQLHHINPTEKEFSIGQIRANPKAWSKIVEELRKCVLLCANCHVEIHHDSTKLPDTYAKFDDRFLDYKSLNVKTDECPTCHAQKPLKNKFCSLSCAARNTKKVDWNSINLEELMKTMNYTQIGRLLNVTGASVKKRAIKLKLLQ